MLVSLYFSCALDKFHLFSGVCLLCFVPPAFRSFAAFGGGGVDNNDTFLQPEVCALLNAFHRNCRSKKYCRQRKQLGHVSEFKGPVGFPPKLVSLTSMCQNKKTQTVMVSLGFPPKQSEPQRVSPQERRLEEGAEAGEPRRSPAARKPGGGKREQSSSQVCPATSPRQGKKPKNAFELPKSRP